MLYPTFDVPQIATPNNGAGYQYKDGYSFDLEDGDFLIDGNGKSVIATEAEAWEQWCSKQLYTERFSCLAYSTDIGVEIDAAVTQQTRAAQESAIERTITEALMADPYKRTTRVSNFSHTWGGQHHHIVHRDRPKQLCHRVAPHEGGMTMGKNFQPPDFLKGQSSREIHKNMLDALPDWMDKSEGSVAYDFTVPTAIEKAKTAEYTLMELVKNLFPQWAYGISLDYIAEQRGLYRKKAAAATAVVTVTVSETISLPAGTRFSTNTAYGKQSAEFESTLEATITDSKDVPVRASTEGSASNVAGSSITILTTPIQGVTGVTNALPATGGVEEETDDELRSRVMEYDYNQGTSFVGCVADYKRWAMSVHGVGSALVIAPQDDTTPIAILITDANGDPASAALCTQVSDSIMCPDAPNERKAPINATIRVTPPTTRTITIRATVKRMDGTTIEAVKAVLVETLKLYYKEALVDGEVRIAKVVQLTMGIPGVIDVTGLQLNGGSGNVILEDDDLPVTERSDVILT